MALDDDVLLVVEDDGLVRLTLVDAMRDQGFTVLEAEDASEAMQLLQSRGDIAGMLTDINMPGQDGFDLARQARALRPGLPIVYASGRYAATDAARSVAGSRFLAKPFAPALAGRTLRSLMHGAA